MVSDEVLSHHTSNRSRDYYLTWNLGAQFCHLSTWRHKFLAKLGETLSAIESKYGITTDIWTSFSNNAYTSLTLHFIDNSWELISYALAIYPFPEQHTGNNMVKKLKEVIMEYIITDDKVMAIVHDQESNFQSRSSFSWREKVEECELCCSLL